MLSFRLFGTCDPVSFAKALPDLNVQIYVIYYYSFVEEVSLHSDHSLER